MNYEAPWEDEERLCQYMAKYKKPVMDALAAKFPINED
jgi:hypothetical protein